MESVKRGRIWKDLLTDNDGQYIELQSGKIFNQPASTSAYTPYKHPLFGPMDIESWEEYCIRFIILEGLLNPIIMGH